MYNKHLYNVMKKEHTRSGPRPQQLDLPSPPQIEIVCVQKSQMLHPAHPQTRLLSDRNNINGRHHKSNKIWNQLS